MLRRILVIGIGAGDPEHITVQAVNALNRTDVVFVVVKGSETRELVELRRQICERYIDHPGYRWVEIPDPARDRSASSHRAAVADWRRERAAIWERVIRDELSEAEQGAFLVWGDPSFYDSTLAVLEEIAAPAALELEVEVIPGISSIQALAAQNRLSLTRVGQPVLITTGRQLAKGLPGAADDVVVMLDANCAFREVAKADTQIYWGAYVGTDDEILISGRVADVGEEIAERRSQARERKGWIMDTYLLRKSPDSGDPV